MSQSCGGRGYGLRSQRRRALTLVLALLLIQASSCHTSWDLALVKQAAASRITDYRNSLSSTQSLHRRKATDLTVSLIPPRGPPVVSPPAASPEFVTFKVSDGDQISCVRIAEQPSAPSNAQLAPSRTPTAGNDSDFTFESVDTASLLFVLEHRAGCPAGTIPYRVSSVANAAAATLRTKYVGGMYTIPQAARSFNGLPTSAGSPSDEHLHAYSYLVGNFTGTEVTSSVWSPFVLGQNAFSVAQLWLIGGSGLPDYNTIEVGWQVYPYKYGDTNPRLFAYWTADAYDKTGCYNLDCPGFVQVSNKVVLGGTVAPASTLDSVQYEIKIRVFKDNATGNWWLQLNDENVGYWPSYLFTYLNTQADAINWGGEIFYSGDATVSVPGLKHDMRPFMGSGEFPTAGFQRAAYHRNIQFVDLQGRLKDAQGLTQSAEMPIWYFAYPFVFDAWKVSFFYGGPGLSFGDQCGSYAASPSPSPA